MTTRATVSQRIQLGVESIPGQAAPANVRLRSINLEPNVAVETKRHEAAGDKFTALVTKGKEWTSIKGDGTPTYDELIYLLAAVIGNRDTTDNEDGTFTHAFEALNAATDDRATLTVERGDDSRAVRAAGARLTELKMAWKRASGDASVSTAGFAGVLADGVALTSGPITEHALEPITAEQVSVFVDASGAALGTTRLARVLSTEVEISGLQAPVWALDASAGSYTDAVETKPSGTVKMLVAADATGMALGLSNLRTGATVFVRIAASDDNGNALTIDTACQVEGLGEFSDEEGVYAIEVTLAIVEDETWGSQHIELTNTVPSI